MRYQICGPGWPLDQWLIPSGVVIDTVDGSDQWSVLVKQRGLPPPVNASPLDQDTCSRMVALYGADRIGPPPT